MADRPHSHETENENLKPGSPPTPVTGGEGSNSHQTKTDPATGESQHASGGQNKSAAEDRSPAAPEDRRARPDV